MTLSDIVAKHIIYTQKERELLRQGPLRKEMFGFGYQQYLEEHPEDLTNIKIHNESYQELVKREVNWSSVRRNALCEIGNYSVYMLMAPLVIAGAMGGGIRVHPDAFDKYKVRPYTYRNEES